MNKKLNLEIYEQDVLKVAPYLIGKLLVKKLNNGKTLRFRIIATKAYSVEEDSACHAIFSLPKRTQLLYENCGHLYIYLCYGIHYLLNVVTGKLVDPQAVLIIGIEGYDET
jgi:DNA-3-methyladenine glycosylase